MKTIIHVNQQIIRNNTKTGFTEPPLTVKTYKENKKGSSVSIKDAKGNIIAEVLYRPNNPLDCGARVWIETQLECEVK